MRFDDWILSKKYGTKKVTPECTQLLHENGETSHFYTRESTAQNKIELPESINFLFENFDGIDLFSSTFKICSNKNPVSINGVDLISPISEMAYRMSEVDFPEPAIPFMNETGNWIYAASLKSNCIYSFDIEYGDIEKHDSVYEIIENWINATED